MEGEGRTSQEPSMSPTMRGKSSARIGAVDGLKLTLGTILSFVGKDTT